MIMIQSKGVRLECLHLEPGFPLNKLGDRASCLPSLYLGGVYISKGSRPHS